MKQLSDYEIGDIVDVFHWGEPCQMKVVGFRTITSQIEVQHLDGHWGGCFYSPHDIERMAGECKNYNKELNRKKDSDLFSNMEYDDTDCLGNNYSDADPGL